MKDNRTRVYRVKSPQGEGKLLFFPGFTTQVQVWADKDPTYVIELPCSREKAARYLHAWRRDGYAMWREQP